MSQPDYKYKKTDFGPLPVDLHHLTIYLSFFPDRVEAVNCLRMTPGEDLAELALDARDLEFVSVEWVDGPEDQRGRPAGYEFRPDKARLMVRPPAPLPAGKAFHLRTRTVCRPDAVTLEGIYLDVAPEGAPPQFMSQCQQWGFQRIMPILDDCRAKCTMTTTLEADAAYTHLISNGDIDREMNPEGRPVKKPGDPSRQVITYVNPRPMAPYLFIAAAGTWDELAGEVVYPSGRKVALKYLVPPGRVDDARIPMEILKDSVLWVGRRQEYEYRGDTYRTICMTRSNFGGMENTGNTTIITEAALIDPQHTMDAFLLYNHAVTVHEFEHNQCGSETTMETPFDVWLNEAYTVDVERRYMADCIDPAYARLRELDAIRDPLMGPLVLEDGGRVGRIVREGFNDPDELIDGVTYVKAAEVIAMLRHILGGETFREARKLYFARYKDGNANSDQFFQCFEEVSGRSLVQFKREWLYTIGYPTVTARGEYDAGARTYRLHFRQEHPVSTGPFQLPLALALVDGDGRDIPGTDITLEITGPETEVALEGIEEAPAFASLNRGATFYGVFREEDAGPEKWAAQASLDPDMVNRVEAMRAYTDRERVKLLEDPGAAVDPGWVDLWGRLLRQPGLSPAIRYYLLGIDYAPLDRAYLAWYPEQVGARDRLVEAVLEAHHGAILETYRSLITYRPAGFPLDGVEDRLLKGLLLGLLAQRDDALAHDLILDQFRAAVAPSDRVTALMALNRTSHPRRLEVLEEAYRGWHGHLNGYGNYLRAVSWGSRPDVFQQIAREAGRESFDITNPGWCRALFLTMALNIRMVWTGEGLDWLTGTIIRLAPVNVTTAGRLLNSFQVIKKMREPLAARCREALEEIIAGVPDEVSPVLHRQALAYRDK